MPRPADFLNSAKPGVEPLLIDPKYFRRNAPYAKPPPYLTALAPNEETQFLRWAAQNRGDLSLSEMLSPVYDMRGFWKAKMAGDPRAITHINPSDKRPHFPDIWKTPHHPTFSNESTYALPNAPHWAAGRLIDENGKTLFDERPRRR